MTHTAAALMTLLQQRGRILAQIVAASTNAATLTEELSVSRATVDRALTDFAEWELLAADTDQLEPTLFGRLVVTIYDEFETAVAVEISHPADGASGQYTAVDCTEVIQLLATRRDLLVCARTPREKRTLVAEVPAARSTVDRAVRELETAGLIQRTAAGYTTTTIGRRLTEQYRETRETLADILAARDLLGHLPSDCAILPSLLAAADIERAATTTPYHLLDGLRERLTTAERIRAVLPALPTPQLLDVCHRQVVRHGATLDLIIDPDLAATLTSEFPGQLAEMAAAATGTVTTVTAETPPFGLVLTETDAGPTVSVLVYREQQTVVGTFHGTTDAVLTWAEDVYERVREQATETPPDWLDASPATDTVALDSIVDPGRVEREAEGFVQLTPDYFVQRTPTPPATAWRAGFNLVDVHAGYAIDRETESNETRQPLTEELIDRLGEGPDHALLGAPGSGKSTVCKMVACRWYEQGRGPVFYRASGTGATFESPAILSAQLRAAEGQTLVVVEDAVRAETNTIFRVMEEFRADPTVTFLLDARTGEWDDPPAFPTDARLNAYRTETVETVTMPALDEHDCERLIEHFRTTTGHDVDVSVTHLLREIDTDFSVAHHQQSSPEPAKLLLLLHRLTLHATPLHDRTANTPTTLAEAVQRTYEELYDAGEMALNVGVLVNLLNAAGLGVQPALVYALAVDKDTLAAVHAALSMLEDHIIFERENGADDASYRTIHESWSELFLHHLLDAADTDTAASQRFGRCVSAVLSLADHAARRTRSAAAVAGDTSIIDQIALAPTEWADTTIERIFHLGLDRPRLAPLFGTTEYAAIALPTDCSPEMEPRCAAWRGRMYFDSGTLDRANDELEHAISLIGDDGESSDVEMEIRAQSYKDLGAVAWRRGDLDTAATFLASALDSYRVIDDRLGVAMCYGNFGLLALDRGDLDRSAAYHERGLDSYHEIGAPKMHRARTLNNLGWTTVLRGDFDRAEAYLERSIDIGHDLDGYFQQTFAVANLGEITRWRGKLDRAEEYYKQAIDIARNAGIPSGTACGLLCLGKLALDRGDLETAAEYVHKSLDIYSESENMRGRARGYRYLGTISRKRNKLTDAEEHFMDALDCCLDDRYRYYRAKTLVELGELACARNSPARACEHFEDAVGLFREMGAMRDAIDGLKRLAATCERIGDTATARTHYETKRTLVQETEYIESSGALDEQ